MLVVFIPPLKLFRYACPAGGAKAKQTRKTQELGGEVESGTRKEAVFARPQGWETMMTLDCTSHTRRRQSHETSKPQVLHSSIAAASSLWTAVMAITSTWYHCCAGHMLTANRPHLAAIVIDRVDCCSYGTARQEGRATAQCRSTADVVYL